VPCDQLQKFKKNKKCISHDYWTNVLKFLRQSTKNYNNYADINMISQLQ